MSTRSGRNVNKVARFDPTDKNHEIVPDEEEDEEEDSDEPKAAKKTKKVAAKKGGKRKVSKENADGTPKEKRPLSAYFLFLAEERPVLVKEQPDLSAKEVVSELASRWKSLPDSKKAKFNATAAKNKAEYDAKKKSKK
ncbi:unnamed protein product [Aphanomyces euteiches]|uniref:HMG box domain-containing protein n=1 Tax=Aphanomyces euteiches TaxID=100861 RepID=A0A6G0XTK4_9STRA|nr:hypothetical protein Ae201684_001388 [Aphanomyces euteiches]KAH9122975.1 hypothetical protein AeMF1_005929 [Aphanomyces euteiches]KAH9136418.1 hypothetical protein LEN26_006151 [Aphanomyces euteiches]KAH9141261.1 hypothetical protein AeRB84_014462 [Aphanomyces euteiches]KAH9142295.1 hypothetical protein AeRB84_013564 [Aphanomyces euteiches]